MRKIFLALLVLFAFASIVYADHVPGHLDFPDLPFLSEAAVDNDPAGTTPILFMLDVGTSDITFVPDYKIRILNVWANIDVTESGAYFITDGTVGNDITNAFPISRSGYRVMEWLDVSLAEIDPATESITINPSTGMTSAEGHIFFLAVRIL